MWVTILEILKYILPSLIVFLTAYLMIRSFLNNDYRKRQLDLRLATQRELLPIKLQAYERLSLFIERISPNSLITRLRKPEMSARELQLTMITSIRHEYEHNLTQQIYVSPEVWGTLTLVKDEIIQIINLVSASIPPNASSKDLSRAIFEFLMKNEEVLPNQRALDVIKSEVKKYFTS